MAGCKHVSVKHVGEQKTDEGVNSYYTCNDCGILLILTPSNNTIGIPGVDSGHD